MKLNNYFKDKNLSVLLVTLETLLIALMLKCFNVQVYLIIIIAILNILTGLIVLIYNYLRKYRFYNLLINSINKLDKKYYVLETMPEPNTYEEKIVVNTLYDINKSMIENIKKREESLTDFKEFVELWIHEVKLPISSLVLKCHNNKDKYSDEFLSIIRKLDNYVDQVLYYVRSEETDKDFIISEVNLKDIVKKVALKNKNDLLENNIDFKVNVDKLNINTDSKWLEYIINQIINNSIKYKKEENSIIKIESSQDKDTTILSIYDNGIGIPKRDIRSIFNKSFTGSNGRNKTKSTGMGLYIVNNLINKLGHKIKVESAENEYTKISIIFKNSDYYKM